jgi:predicted RNase H-like HicB family nuclease
MYHVKIKKGKDGYYVAQCKELPAAITQGKTKKEAVENIREAIELVLEDMKAEIREKKLIVVEA